MLFLFAQLAVGKVTADQSGRYFKVVPGESTDLSGLGLHAPAPLLRAIDLLPTTGNSPEPLVGRKVCLPPPRCHISWRPLHAAAAAAAFSFFVLLLLLLLPHFVLLLLLSCCCYLTLLLLLLLLPLSGDADYDGRRDDPRRST